MGTGRLFRTERQRQAVLHHDSAAERDRLAAHGPRVPAHHHGHADPLSAHERRSNAVADGYRPCRYLDADAGRATTQRARSQQSGDRPRSVRRESLGMESRLWRTHLGADAPYGVVARLGSRALYDGRRIRPRRSRSVRTAVRRRSDLSRAAPGQLGPGTEDGYFGPRGRKHGGTGQPLALQISVVRRRPNVGRPRLRSRRNDAAGNDARRHGRGSAPRRRTLQSTRRQTRASAADRSRNPDHRRHATSIRHSAAAA